MNHGRHVETAFAGHLFRVEVLTARDAEGRAVRREVVRHPGAVLVIPVLDSDTVVMIENNRVAVGQTLWEFPAGKLEPGEEPQAAATRELEEETGYRCGSIRRLGEFYTSPGFTDELMHVFVAEDLAFVGQRLEAGEHITAHRIPVSQGLAMVADGRLRDGKSVAALLMWRQSAAPGNST